jgi:hypothetical protein
MAVASTTAVVLALGLVALVPAVGDTTEWLLVAALDGVRNLRFRRTPKGSPFAKATGGPATATVASGEAIAEKVNLSLTDMWDVSARITTDVQVRDCRDRSCVAFPACFGDDLL